MVKLVWKFLRQYVLKVIIFCSYIRNVMNRHSKYADGRTEPNEQFRSVLSTVNI